MNILVIGGTKFIGPPVVYHLTAMGHNVTVFHRGKTDATLPEDVHHLLGERTHLSDFKSEFERLSPQVVLDMFPYTEQDALTLMNTFKGITQRIIAISSMDVYRAYGVLLGKESGVVSVPLTEDSPLRQQLYPFREMPKRPLNASPDYEKILVEQVVMADSDLPGTIVRLPMVYGAKDPRNRLFPFLQRMDDRRPAIVLEESIARWQASYGYVENVAYGIALATSDHRAMNRIYNVADLEVLSEAERIAKVGKVAGWKGKVVAVPKEHLPVEWKLTINTEQHWYTDTTRIRQELGYKEIVPLEEGIMRTIDWERTHPPEDSEQLAVPWLLEYTTEDAILADIHL